MLINTSHERTPADEIYNGYEMQDALDEHAEELVLDILSGISDLADDKLGLRYPDVYDLIDRIGKHYNVDIHEFEVSEDSK